MLMYVQDYDNVSPPAARWPEAIYPYLRNEEIFVCPSDVQPHRSELQSWPLSYTMTDALGQTYFFQRPRPAEEIVFFDGSVLKGGAETADFRHEGNLFAGYLDGHVSAVQEADWEREWQGAAEAGQR